MIRLGKMKRALLQAAAERDDLALLPAPEAVATRVVARTRALGGLLRDGLAEERVAAAGDMVWREEDGLSYALFATAEGLRAIGADPDRCAISTPEAGGDDLPPRPGGKLGIVLDAVDAGDGAGLDELAAATGWLPHTTRAVISRLRKRGYDIRLTGAGDRKVYRLARGA